MKKEIITKGTIIDTIDGFLVIEERNDGGLYKASHCTFNEFTGTVEGDALLLTAADIERHMKEVDGRNHKVEWTDVRYFLDFSATDPDVFTLKTIEERDDFCTGRLSDIPGADVDWQDALDKYFEEKFDIKPNEWEVG